MKFFHACCLLLASACVLAEEPAAVPVPDAAGALAAYEVFRAAPLGGLERTLPFLAYIRDSGAVHIVLNNELLAWMYEPMDQEIKAVLYAAFLGGNMAAQIRSGTSGNDDVAGVASALDAYTQVQQAHPDFRLAQFERFAAARAQDGLGAAVNGIVNGEDRHE